MIDLPEPEHLSIAREIYEQEDLRKIRVDDIRFGAHVREIDSKARTLGEALVRVLRSRRRAPARLLAALRTAKQALADEKKLSLEAELLSLVQSTSIRRAKPVIRCLGWDGKGGGTLQLAADEEGITRERVRQLVEKAEQQIVKGSFAPVLDKVLSTLPKAMASAEDLEQSWLTSGLTNDKFRSEGVLAAAAILKGSCTFRVVEINGRRFLVTPSIERLIPAVRKFVTHTCARFTVMSLREVQAKFETVGWSDEIDFVSMIESLSGFGWLHRGSGWFWIKGPRSRLLTRIRKILSVAPAISLGDLRRTRYKKGTIYLFVVSRFYRATMKF